MNIWTAQPRLNLLMSLRYRDSWAVQTFKTLSNVNRDTSPVVVRIIVIINALVPTNEHVLIFTTAQHLLCFKLSLTMQPQPEVHIFVHILNQQCSQFILRYVSQLHE